MVKVGVICLHAKDWKRGAEFWAAALDHAPRQPVAKSVAMLHDHQAR